MISRTHKFPLRLEFLNFRAHATKSTTPHFLIYSHKSTGPSRFAVTVPKKVSKLATTRNYLKRLTYDLLWKKYRDKNLDLVIVYKPLPLKRNSLTRQLIHSELHV